MTKGAALEKGHFTWITEKGRQERWVVASCGNYTVLWNFRWERAVQLLGWAATCMGWLGWLACEDCLRAHAKMAVHLAWLRSCRVAQNPRCLVPSCPFQTPLQPALPPPCSRPRRSVKIAEPEVVSYGGLTTVTKYHMVRKDEHVVDSGEWL